jgi:hypothetical protein
LNFLDENLRETLQDLRKDNDFLNRAPTAQKIGARIDKWDCIKLKSFCTAKETIRRIKKQSTQWEKMPAKPLSKFTATSSLQQLNFPISSAKCLFIMTILVGN